MIEPGLRRTTFSVIGDEPHTTAMLDVSDVPSEGRPGFGLACRKQGVVFAAG